MRKRCDRLVAHYPAMVDYFLEFDGRLLTLMSGQIRATSHIHRIQVLRKAPGPRIAELVGGGSLKKFNGFGGIVPVERKLPANCRQADGLHHGVLRKLLS